LEEDREDREEEVVDLRFLLLLAAASWIGLLVTMVWIRREK